MKEFNSIWTEFDWVIDEFKNGMCFFEGYIPSIFKEDLLQPFSKLIEKSEAHRFSSSIWSDDISDEDLEDEYTPRQYIEFFNNNRIVLLHFDYEFRNEDISLNHKLIIETTNAMTSLEMICYREPILELKNQKDGVKIAISEFRNLKKLFKGNTLFIGPDTLNYPLNENEYPDEWLKID